MLIHRSDTPSPTRPAAHPDLISLMAHATLFASTICRSARPLLRSGSTVLRATPPDLTRIQYNMKGVF